MYHNIFCYLYLSIETPHTKANASPIETVRLSSGAKLDYEKTEVLKRKKKYNFSVSNDNISMKLSAIIYKDKSNTESIIYMCIQARVTRQCKKKPYKLIEG